MRYLSYFKVVLVAFLIVFMAASCVKEGPMGPAGEDGIDGIDGVDGASGEVTCLQCHEGTALDQKSAEFEISAHSAGAIAVDYAGGRASCAPCHSHEQFVQTMTLGGVAGDISNPSAWKCNTCHGIHETFDVGDFALRSTEPVDARYAEGEVLDVNGNSNLCAVCHQSRRGGPSITNPGEETFRITSTHYGPHYGTQANVLLGVGLEELEGSVAYPEAGSAVHLAQASCTGCHMADFTAGQGGHSFVPSVAACNDCHGTPTEDYNYGGVQTEVNTMLVELRDRLIELGVVAGDEEEGFHPVVGTFPTLLVQAYFNWEGIAEDRSLGVHNPKYVKAILRNTLDAVNAYEPAPEV